MELGWFRLWGLKEGWSAHILSWKLNQEAAGSHGRSVTNTEQKLQSTSAETPGFLSAGGPGVWGTPCKLSRVEHDPKG